MQAATISLRLVRSPARSASSGSGGVRSYVTECEHDVRPYAHANRLAEHPLTRSDNASTDVTRLALTPFEVRQTWEDLQKTAA